MSRNAVGIDKSELQESVMDYKIRTILEGEGRLLKDFLFCAGGSASATQINYQSAGAAGIYSLLWEGKRRHRINCGG